MVSNAICEALACAYMYNLMVEVPMIFKGSQMCYSMFRMDENRFAYIALTKAEEGREDSGESFVFMPWRSLIRHAAQNMDYEGLMINPYHKTPHGAIIYLNRDNLEHIIRYAEKTINGLPDNVRDAVIRGI